MPRLFFNFQCIQKIQILVDAFMICMTEQYLRLFTTLLALIIPEIKYCFQVATKCFCTLNKKLPPHKLYIFGTHHSKT